VKSETSEIVLQLLETILEQQRMICDLARNDLLLIESRLSEPSSEQLVVAAGVVRSTLYSVDALADRIRLLDSQARNR
jgi:hypothetical protein